MIGFVDDKGRALLEIAVCANAVDPSTGITVWIDTAFDGHLVFSRKLIETLGLDPLVETDAILADGSKVVLKTFVCFLDWFGERIPLQVIANEGRFPLLGTALLDERVLHVDYQRKSLTLD
jgi:clan AA aspartic protease